MTEDCKKQIEELIKRIEMLEAAMFAPAQEKATSKKYVSTVKKKKKKDIVIPPELSLLSHSEIVEIARHAFSKHMTPEDISKITLQIPKDDLVSAIKGETMIGVVVDPIGHIRESIFSYINSNDLLKSALTCSTHCPTCPYSKVINCYTINKRRINNENRGLNLSNKNI